jgi:lipoate-protein ligase A
MGGSRQRRTWRLVIDGPDNAAANMARDEAILLAAADDATVRFYSWRPWAFSLGYFQRYADFEAQARRGIAIVRRLTGGGAIYHADELTYSLVGPFGTRGFPRRAAGIFEKVHGAIRQGLRALGVEAQLSDAPTGRSATICFERPQKFDIVVGEKKLVGSAQRRYGGHFLQHGSLPLSQNEFAPGAASLEELVAKRPSDATITEALSRAFEEAFGVRLVRGGLSAEEEAAAARLAAEKYGRPEWNRRR